MMDPLRRTIDLYATQTRAAMASGLPDDAYALARNTATLARASLPFWQKVVWACIALCSACSGGSPTAPTPTPPPAAQATITGRVSATNGGQPLGGLTVDMGGAPTTTDAAGVFHLSVAPMASMRAALTGAAILPRTVYVAAGA